MFPAEVLAEIDKTFKKGNSAPAKSGPILMPAQQLKQSTEIQRQPISIQVRQLQQSAEVQYQLTSLPTQRPATPPQELKLRADRQRYDARQERFIAEGQVRALLNGGVLKADRIEFDKDFNTLYARGSVRFRKGSQYFQASSLRYSLIQKEGELEDVYGVLDLDTAAIDLNPNSQTTDQTPNGTSPPQTRLPIQKSKKEPGMACPTVLPSIPEWHPNPWAVTAWGGQMIDSNFGDTFLFNGRIRPEYLLGLGIQKRIHRAGPFALELEADFFGHHANKQAGGEFNQSVPFADTPTQSFGEGVLGIGARLWVQPWLSFGVIEGISFNTANSNYERTYRENYSQLLNYLGFEVEATVSEQLSLVGRIHHRSGAFGTYNDVKEGSNAYLLGLRYRWGEDNKLAKQVDLPPPLGCPDSDRADRPTRQNLSEKLESITLGDGDPAAQTVALPQDTTPAAAHRPTQTSTSKLSLSPAEQEALRNKEIAKIDQRINNIQFQQTLTIESQHDITKGNEDNENVEEENKFGGIRATQLQGKSELVTGSISRWRVQSAKVTISPEGWKADRMGFSNDPFTPAQTRIDAEDVVATEAANGDILISSRRNQLIVEERLPIPVSRNQRIKKQEEVENRWVFGTDKKDRDGFFVGRELQPIELSKNYTLSLQPQFLLERAKDGDTNSYVAPGSSTDSSKVSQSVTAADLLGLEVELSGQTWGWKLDLNADLSTFNPQNFTNGSRYWGDIKKDLDLPLIGSIDAHIFGAYRYKAWNGSLGETDIYSAYGALLQKEGSWRWGKLNNNYLLRAGVGNYQAEEFKSDNLADLWRANFYGSLNSSYPLWRGKHAALTPEAAYRYSPVAIVPGLDFKTNLRTSLSAYSDQSAGQRTITLSGGPTMTLGTFSKPFLDYTQLSLSAGATLKGGNDSPFAFDQAIDLGTFGVGITQQIAGPLVVNAGIDLNIDAASPSYGDVINSNIEVIWRRRSYDFGFYYNPYKGIGGVRFRLNDFNFNGTGVPFVPYTPNNQANQLEESLF
ncbi:MAG TPA: DUF3769 domain-containing protein [Prochlorococcus sp.]